MGTDDFKEILEKLYLQLGDKYFDFNKDMVSLTNDITEPMPRTPELIKEDLKNAKNTLEIITLNRELDDSYKYYYDGLRRKALNDNLYREQNLISRVHNSLIEEKEFLSEEEYQIAFNEEYKIMKEEENQKEFEDMENIYLDRLKKKTLEDCRTYTVNKGDCLWGIADTYLNNGARYKEIMRLNGLMSTVIHPNQVLKLPLI